jgi:hypothetical protein
MSTHESKLSISGNVSHVVTRGGQRTIQPLVEYPSAIKLRGIIEAGMPAKHQHPEVRAWRERNQRHLWRGLRTAMAARALRVPTMYGAVYHTVLRGDGTLVPLGLASMRVVTTVGVNFLVDALQGTVEPEILRFHGWGTGNTAEAIGNTALVTELTTQYNPDSTRPTGTLAEGASANIFRTVATLTPDSGGVIAVVEHGIFSQAATGGGTLLDRSVFAAINLDSANGDSLQTTYELTINAGG